MWCSGRRCPGGHVGVWARCRRGTAASPGRRGRGSRRGRIRAGRSLRIRRAPGRPVPRVPGGGRRGVLGRAAPSKRGGIRVVGRRRVGVSRVQSGGDDRFDGRADPVRQRSAGDDAAHLLGAPARLQHGGYDLSLIPQSGPRQEQFGMLQADRRQQPGTRRRLLWSRRTGCALPAAGLCPCRVIGLAPARVTDGWTDGAGVLVGGLLSDGVLCWRVGLRRFSLRRFFRLWPQPAVFLPGGGRRDGRWWPQPRPAVTIGQQACALPRVPLVAEPTTCASARRGLRSLGAPSRGV